MGGVICQTSDRKKDQEKKEVNDNIHYIDKIDQQKNEKGNSPSKNGFYSPTKTTRHESKSDLNGANKVTIDTNLLVTKGTTNNKNNYKRTKILGQGSFGTVFLVKHKILNTYFAMKVIKKTNKSEKDEVLMNEINILRKMDHPNIVKITDFYTTNTEYILVTEYCPEGELFYEIKNFAPFNEALTGWYMKQILSAVTYCHKLKIIHRDLKPENILISERNKKGFNTIKIIDFGTAILFNKKDKKLAGSIYYLAPEIISKNRNYTEKCDIWSCGIIMYILLTGRPPFNGQTEDDIMKKIKIGTFEMTKYPWGLSLRKQKI